MHHRRSEAKNGLRPVSYLDEDGRLKVIPEYPEFAWFEGLVNAVTHRDYSPRGDCIRVSMCDDRLEVFSPGALPNIVTLDNMRTTRYSRNPTIARRLCDFGWVPELNGGVQRIYGATVPSVSVGGKAPAACPQMRGTQEHLQILYLW